MVPVPFLSAFAVSAPEGAGPEAGASAGLFAEACHSFNNNAGQRRCLISGLVDASASTGDSHPEPFPQTYDLTVSASTRPLCFCGERLAEPRTRGRGSRLSGARKAGLDPEKLVEVYETQAGDGTEHWADEK